ncbi:MAG TPA: ZPR1 zinc finger domain-containing protein [Methanocorpusculum sp.]|nr:ZPR1 zinc finger domain-containing protein [Methanocorpusculum sp.]
MRQVVPGPCPSCGFDIEYIYDTETIPYFSEILLLSGVCPKCGFKVTDTMILSDHEPCQWNLLVNSIDDLNIRVVRSTQGEIDIPEFGINIKPGPACNGFVSNVEGLLVRAEDGVKCAMSSCESDDEISKAKDVLSRLQLAKEAKIPFNIIISDPSGNSGIVSPKAIKTKLNIDPNDLNGLSIKHL